MIILRSNGGQLCNKIWSYAPFIGHSLKHRSSLFIIDFDESVGLFEDLNKLYKVHFVTNKYQKKLLRQIAKFCSRLFPVSKFDYLRPFWGISEFNGWEFRSETEYISEYRDSIRNLFFPCPECVQKSSTFVKSIKGNSILVGVHIRRKDYKTHMNGAYFYDNEVYYQIMLSLSCELTKNSSSSVSFLICSDEQIDVNYFKGLDCHQLLNANNVEDLYSLSLCDYIFGPPSTFSMWASYYGNVPLFLVSDIHQEMSISMFKVIKAVDIFNDGTRFKHSSEFE
jgi:Glycosyl transferase family 11